MKLYWHIGPHKTATTAVQAALQTHAMSGRASYYYPEPATPGHAELAARFLGFNGQRPDPDLPLRVAEEAAKAGYDRVVLTSEDFSYAAMSNQFPSFARVCDEVECEIVLTLRPLLDRFVPELQESVKCGSAFRFYDAEELIRFATERPGLLPDFLSAVVDGTKPCAISVIHVSKADRESVYRGMSAVIGEAIPTPPLTLVNPSMPFLKAAWFSVLNSYFPDMPLRDARAAVNMALEAASRRYRGLGDLEFPPLPASFSTHLEQIWNAQTAYLDVLEATGRLRSFR